MWIWNRSWCSRLSVKVLIDTWWNVNYVQPDGTYSMGHSFNRYMVECEFYSFYFCIFKAEVLIDTWWNVNMCTRGSLIVRLGFNRYMVECECSYHRWFFVRIIVLIDTWWNVNAIVSKISPTHFQVLIDTWWNVNVHWGFNANFLSDVLIDTWWNVNEFNLFLSFIL